MFNIWMLMIGRSVVFKITANVKAMSSGGFRTTYLNLVQMTTESTDLQNSTNPAITYSECYQQCFCSDNLELMKTIESNTIDLIYCDILYGTGKDFRDYKDLNPIRSEIESHYIPRLIEMKRVLKQNSSIYLQMDCKISHWMRCLMDNVFGYKNFKNEIIWYYMNKIPDTRKKMFTQSNDVILFYAMGDYTFNTIEDARVKPIVVSKIKKVNGKKIYVKDDDGKGIYEVRDSRVADSIVNIPLLHCQPERTGYPTQKPKELISRFVLASTNEGDTVADYYLGSGTTAVVCKELNRNFIGCDINPKAIEITKSRLSDVGL
jgi:DNA modification methylase